MPMVFIYASVAELADAQGLGPCVLLGLVGSTPTARISFWLNNEVFEPFFEFFYIHKFVFAVI